MISLLHMVSLAGYLSSSGRGAEDTTFPLLHMVSFDGYLSWLERGANNAKVKGSIPGFGRALLFPK